MGCPFSKSFSLLGTSNAGGLGDTAFRCETSRECGTLISPWAVPSPPAPLSHLFQVHAVGSEDAGNSDVRSPHAADQLVPSRPPHHVESVLHSPSTAGLGKGSAEKRKLHVKKGKRKCLLLSSCRLPSQHDTHHTALSPPRLRIKLGSLPGLEQDRAGGVGQQANTWLNGHKGLRFKVSILVPSPHLG